MIRRATKDLEHLQGERWRRATLKLTGPIDPAELGLAPMKEAMSDIPDENERNHLMVRSAMMGTAAQAAAAQPPDKVPLQSVAVGRNETCPCGSGQKHKRCCGHWSKAA